MPDTLYIFIDESGDFNFSKNGSKYYIFTAVMTKFPTDKVEEIRETHLNLISGKLLSALDIEYLDKKLCSGFHATEDKQQVRDIFFSQISRMDKIQVNSVVVRKNRTNPVLREPKKFYARFLSSLLSYVFQAYSFSDLCILINGCAITANKKVFKQTVADEIKNKMTNCKFRIFFPESSTFYHLQIVDYISWAIYRKWENNDCQSYDLIKDKLRKPELDIFWNGDKDYY